MHWIQLYCAPLAVQYIKTCETLLYDASFVYFLDTQNKDS